MSANLQQSRLPTNGTDAGIVELDSAAQSRNDGNGRIIRDDGGARRIGSGLRRREGVQDGPLGFA
jgi:hypothetical protein